MKRFFRTYMLLWMCCLLAVPAMAETGEVSIPTHSAGEPCPGGSGCPSAVFADFDADAGYHEVVDDVLSKQVMQGTGNETFSPLEPMTRAQLLTVLWRMEGMPVVNMIIPFSDVEQDLWYSEAVRWGASQGLTQGYEDGTFRPMQPLTRAEMTTILYRYDRPKSGGFTGMWMFPLRYADSAEVPSWAYEATCWMTMHGVVQSNEDDRLEPGAEIQRCQAADILMRYLNKQA